MFFRIFRQPFKEVIYNSANIWKIEVGYVDEGGWRTGIQAAATNENVTRSYKLFIGSEEILIDGSENNAVTSLISDIYKAAVKAEPPTENEESE